MNDPQQRKRLFVLCAAGGFILLMLLFVTLFAPSANPGGEGALTVRAGTEAAAPTTSTNNGFSLGGGDLVSLAWRLALVAIIIAVSIAGLRWWGRKSAGPRSVTGFLRVVDTLAISNGRSVHLLALGDRVIAIGATAQQVTWLSDLTEDESARILADSAATSDHSIAGFAAELFQSMRRDRSMASVPGAARAFKAPADARPRE